jgi:iron complex outermembrane recepter protein
MRSLARINTRQSSSPCSTASQAISSTAPIRTENSSAARLTLAGNNLADQYRHRWTDDFARRNYENNHFRRVFMAGIRVQM